MRYTIQKLKQVAVQFGASVDVNSYSNTDKEIQIAAPDGKQWVEGNCINMRGEYYTYIHEGEYSKQEVIKTLINRMNQGLEEFNEELNG
jgi:hypothetical protein